MSSWSWRALVGTVLKGLAPLSLMRYVHTHATNWDRRHTDTWMHHRHHLACRMASKRQSLGGTVNPQPQ